MTSEALSKVKFPICQDVSCKKYATSDRTFWKREVDHQYQFYLTTLRSQRDKKYLNEEHSLLLSEIRKAEDTNVELRKEIRMLELELYVMSQRNAHDSFIIDGLHEADYEAEETELMESQIRRRLQFATVECNHEETLIRMLQEEITLLRRKEDEDAELILCLKPLDKQLKEVLELEKMKNHQQAMKFKRELEELFSEFHRKNSHLTAIKSEKSTAEMWAKGMFTSFWQEKMVVLAAPTDSDASSIGSSQETESFEVTTEEDIPADDLGEEFQSMKREYCEFVAMKELLDSKNFVNMHLIHDHLQRIVEAVDNMAEEYMILFKVMTEIAFIKEYLERLDMMRKKKDVVHLDEDLPREAERLDQMNLIFNSLLAENEFIGNTLHFFTSTMKEDFETHVVHLQKTEELFRKADVEKA